MVEGTEGTTTGVVPRRDRHECGTGTRRQRPIQLRRTGQTVGRPVRPSIESVGLMNALRSKFSQNEELKKFLLATGTTTIGEASAHDTKYGIGLSLRNPNPMNTDR